VHSGMCRASCVLCACKMKIGKCGGNLRESEEVEVVLAGMSSGVSVAGVVVRGEFHCGDTCYKSGAHS
jgi:hypothetical protein